MTPSLATSMRAPRALRLRRPVPDGARAIALAAALLAAGAMPACAVTAAPQPVRVKIIAFNDYHGNLESPGTFGVNTTVPSAQRPPVGGAAMPSA